MSIEIRPITVHEWDAYTLANAAAFDGAEIAGTTSLYSFDLTVPGGALPTAGVTWVSVKPTHRRRGVLRQIMQRQLNDVHERNEPLAALWASESIIYGRFGYGLAAQNQELTIDRLRTTLTAQVPVCGRTRLVTRDQALEAWPAVYDEARRAQPGFYSRSDKWWRHQTMREKDLERRAGSRFNVQYEEDGSVRGYARYRIRPGQDGMASGTLSVWELTALTSNAYSALWQYIFGADLVASIEAVHRPIDEPIYWMLADPRRLVRRPYDSLWLRIIDVAPALEGRRYASAGRVVLDVRDPFCPWNEGRYELEAGAEGAGCRRTDAEADVTLSAADLGAVYLGGSRLTTLHRAERVEGEWEAIRRADAMFSWDPLPWCAEVF